jgi:cyclic pyranopterin phosphate synthase
MLPLLPLLRDPASGDDALQAAIRHSMGIKPLGHDFDVQRPTPKVVRFMSVTGG